MPVTRRERKALQRAAAGNVLDGRTKKVQFVWTLDDSYPSLTQLRVFVIKINCNVSTRPVEEGMVVAALGAHLREAYNRDKNWDSNNPLQVNRMSKNVCDSISVWGIKEKEARERKDREHGCFEANKYADIVLRNEQGFEWSPSTMDIPEGSHFIAYRPDVLAETAGLKDEAEDQDQGEQDPGEGSSQPSRA